MCERMTVDHSSWDCMCPNLRNCRYAFGELFALRTVNKICDDEIFAGKWFPMQLK